jgi:Flp pilus assembly pilin Flp
VTWFRILGARLATGLRQPAAQEQGQALIEYALVVSLIALAAVMALTLTGTNLSSVLHRIAGEA